jgi:hypothetical protein
MGILAKAEAASEVTEQLGQMGRAVLIVERNVGRYRKKIHPPQLFFDRRLEFSLQYSRHALWLLSHPASCDPIRSWHTLTTASHSRDSGGCSKQTTTIIPAAISHRR